MESHRYENKHFNSVADQYFLWFLIHAVQITIDFLANARYVPVYPIIVYCSGKRTRSTEKRKQGNLRLFRKRRERKGKKIGSTYGKRNFCS